MQRLVLFLLLLLNSGTLLPVSCADQQYSRYDFPLPPDFVFGAGSSAYQYEGAAFEDGRTPTTWDTFAHEGYSNGNGDIACDGYHKYKEDVQLMAETGLEAFRLSISWPRLIPNGRGPVNPKALEYYNNFINELISHGIQPHVTLFHVDFPQALEDEYGGWISRKIVEDFRAYADVCFREFGDRVLHWTTLNEANIYVITGYDAGMLPPLRCSAPFGVLNCTKGNSSSEPYIAAHNMLLAHGSAARLYKKMYQGRQHGLIGINMLAFGFIPYTNAKEDVIATQRANDFWVGWFINPLVFGDYPEVVKKNVGARLPTFSKLESKQVKGSFDFIGLNHYATLLVKDSPGSLKKDPRDFIADSAITLKFKEELDGNSGHERVSDKAYQGHLPLTYKQLGEFPLTPSGLLVVLEYFKQSYGNPPVYIHENGQSMQRNGTLNDVPRVEFLRVFIGAVLDAVRNGSNTKGYFMWSFLDLFELMGGYETGYGLYYVDLDDKDLKRYPKLSAHWYSNFLKGGNINDDRAVEEINKNMLDISESHSSQ